MADVLIIYTADKQKVAARLGEAIGSEGYSAASEQVGDPDLLPSILDEARTADAALLIWSRPLVSAALRKSVLDKVRRQKNLIQVSPDGIAPSSEGDEGRVVLISGWRGQPFHPGWQRILADVKRLCGAPPPPEETSTLPPDLPDIFPEPAERPPAAATAPASGGKPRFTGAAIAILVMLGLAIGAAAWVGRGGFSENGPSRPQPAIAAPSPAPSIPASTPQPGAAQPNAVVPAQPAAAPLSGPLVKSETQPANASPAATSAAAGSGRKSSAVTSKSARDSRARDRQASRKRYSPRHSETMRLFCERSGRSTPQCRTFRRSPTAAPPRVLGPAA